jgi:hypothetical protein
VELGAALIGKAREVVRLRRCVQGVREDRSQAVCRVPIRTFVLRSGFHVEQIIDKTDVPRLIVCTNHAAAAPGVGSSPQADGLLFGSGLNTTPGGNPLAEWVESMNAR